MGESGKRTEVFYIDTRGFCDKGAVSRAYLQLPELRRNKIDAYKFDAGKRLSLGAGYLLSLALRAIGKSECEADIGYNRYGKPLVKAGGLHFNLSHSGDIAVCAVSCADVGVDIEKRGTADDALIRRACTKAEAERILSLDGSARNDMFYRTWTVKESYMKYLGLGFAVPPDELEIDFGAGITLYREGAAQPVRFFEYPLDGYYVTACGMTDFAPDMIEVKLDQTP